MGRQVPFGQRSEDLFGRPTCCLEQDVDRHGPRAFTIEPVGRAGCAVSASGTSPAPVRSPSCSTTAFAYRKSFARSAKSGNGFPMLACRLCAFMPALSATFRSSSLVGARTSTGQFVLAVDGARDDPDDPFDRAHAAEQVGDIAEAERLYRLLMKSDPTDASAPFNLGNILRASNRIVEAEAALRAATRANPAFAEAWYNLADLLDDQGRSEAAVECLRKALVVAPDYIDAVFNLALLLQRKGSYAEATDCWRRYLASDHASEWAGRARIGEILRDPAQFAHRPL